MINIFQKFKDGLKKTTSNFSKGIKDIVVNKEIDDKTLEEIEEFLIQSDVGVEASSEIRQQIANSRIDPSKNKLDEINKILKEYILSLMKPLENKNFFHQSNENRTILVSGVNGVGKTTTIGKMSKIFQNNNNKTVLAACDTFRAAAIDQLENWSKKVGSEIIKSDAGSDPASVAFKAMEYSKKNKIHTVLIDTAGRLQNKKNLMDEYKKIANVVKKVDNNAPHDVVLILDATSGQNVINQVTEFNNIIPLTGLVMTKLDGTAKGGILIAAAKKFKLPIIAIGLGEKEDDLQSFDAETFAENLARCQRYFRQIGTIRKQGANGDPVGMTIPLEPTMRASPTVAATNSTGGSHSIAGTGNFPNTQIIYSGTAATSGGTAFIQFTGVTADAEL